MYDVAIIGAGVTGSAIARELSRYQLNVCVIEREEDVCCGTSKANSAIIHAGFDAVPGTLKAKVNVKGNAMMDQIAKEESNTILPTLMRELEHYNVQIVTSAKLSEIKDDSVVVEKTIDDNTSTEEIASDFVVMAVGARKNLPELSDCPLPLHYIGDCAGERPSNIEHAIKSAYDVACEI